MCISFYERVKKMKILVFPCGSEIGLEIHNSLKFIKDIELYGASSEASNHGKYVYKNYIGGLPFVEEENFLEEINKLVEKYSIDFLFPAHDSVVLELSKYKREIKCKIITSDYKTCLLCRSKKKTYEYFKHDIRVPKVYKSSQEIIEYPVFLKPDVGQGSKGTVLVNSQEELNFFTKRDSSLLILEYLPGEEYTIDCFTDRKGKLIYVSARERSRIANGISVETSHYRNEKFEELANFINEKLKLRGTWFFQVKKNVYGELTLLEIAPRIAGSSGINRSIGVNLPLLNIYDLLGFDLEIISNNGDGITMDRALTNRYMINMDYSHVYIDLDDTLILKNKVNNYLVSFLYQCINRGIKLHLITRHVSEIKSTLIQFRILSLFDSLIHVKKNQKKSELIKHKDSIFIDDSFRERKDVSEQKGIPTFDISSVECLIDWRI